MRWPGARARGPPPFFPFPLRFWPAVLFLPIRLALDAASGFSSSSPEDEDDSELKDDSEKETRRLLVGGSGSPSKASLRKEEAGETGAFGESGTAENVEPFYVSREICGLLREARVSDSGLPTCSGSVICFRRESMSGSV